MSDSEPLPQYFIAAGVLHVTRNPKFNDPEFQKHCEWLLESTQPKIVIDLTRIAYLQSPEISCLCKVILQARTRKKTVDLRISPTVLLVLKKMNLDKIAGLHAPDDPAFLDE